MISCHVMKCYNLLVKWCMQYLCFLRNVLHMIWTLIKIALIWIQGLSQLWNSEIRMIAHLCHDLEIDRKGFPFFLTMTKEEITCMHNSRRKQIFTSQKRRNCYLEHLKKQKKQRCYLAYLKKQNMLTCASSKVDEIFIFQEARVAFLNISNLLACMM